MVVDVKLCKEEGKPFGFRLIGGADFEIPLTCSKVRKAKKKRRKKNELSTGEDESCDTFESCFSTRKLNLRMIA